MDKVYTQAKPIKLGMVLLLGTLASFGPLSLDMYLPALPQVANDLHTTASLAQLSLTFCLLGLALGQIIVGPLSDMKGRRKPLIVSMVFYALSSILCAYSPSVTFLIIMRFIQGFTGAAGIVIARASARDMYSGKELTAFFSMLMLVNGAAPILAPITGGFVLQFSEWPTVFIILAIIGFFIFIAVTAALPESLPFEKRTTGGLKETLQTFRLLLGDRSFMGFAFSQAFILTGMFAYISGSPFVLQNIFGVSAQMFSFLFAVNGAGIIAATQITGRLAAKRDERTLFTFGLILSIIGSIALLAALALNLGIIAVCIALFVIVSCVGIVTTTGFALAMQKQEKGAGSAAALLGLLPFIGGALAAPLVGIAGEENAWPMALSIFGFDLLAVLSYVFLVKRNTQT
ncbi:multidrug effflux MFS transporter [Bacillus atrophaeus]|uniref:Bcr/CflA family efflux transporter n=1 Tax=Bacillus atrophaeus (strain 1942) TaxID=720555 RepID=A0ABM5M2A6_BACA1|nr:multidrug effflux MFS transporter [Bacillus atrophaeus]AMR61054.1 Bcr/CflA family drug resistance efflux transporter [Bacillus subtilis subsp. globigii]ADP34281.1 putative drug resistance transporter [Bacillus atrophaeus 1942]AIK45630.1 drug resistance transporter, Bcr/CflA subfamily protein [Bacillus atrophaeus subsp. globigii]EIM11303.1 putative drug resistance transporter [Bacillus atrophaeus C89]KFK81877.1 drug resistance transporter, Bcr/CflA subfamily protein [Bacillus atrophaeus]